MLLMELAEVDPAAYRNIMRWSSQTKSDDLLKMVTTAITEINTPTRNAIPSKTKLEVTLRYSASVGGGIARRLTIITHFG